MEQHLEKLQDLIRIENEEDLRIYRQEMLQTPLQERKKRGKTWHPVRIHAQDFGMGQLLLTLERSSNLGEPHSFQVGSMVMLYSYRTKCF